MHLIGNRAPFFLYINLTVQKAMKYGFIGIGTLAEAIIDGLIGTKLSVDSVIVSPRNAQVSARLAARHGVVTIASHNQAVVDNSDMVFIAVRPQVVESVLTSLKFPKGQHVVSLVAATSTQKLRSWVGSDTILTQAIPLPFVSARQGVTAVHPQHQKSAPYSQHWAVVRLLKPKKNSKLPA